MQSAPGAGDLVEYTGLILTHDCGTISQTADAGLDPGDQMCAGDYKYGASVECTQDQRCVAYRTREGAVLTTNGCLRRGMLPISAKDTGGDSWVCQGLQKNTQCSSTVVVKACCSRSST